MMDGIRGHPLRARDHVRRVRVHVVAGDRERCNSTARAALTGHTALTRGASVAAVAGRTPRADVRRCRRIAHDHGSTALTPSARIGGRRSGSATLVRSLLRDNLLDELQLLVHPIVVGHGKRLFPEGTEQIPLRLVDAKTFSTGVLYLTYARAADNSA